MGLFDFLRGYDINAGVEEQRAVNGSLLVDVRTEEEYQSGHIPGSKNIPLHAIDKISSATENKSTPLYLYCYSGARSRQAAAAVQRMGYRNVKNIGGICAWQGKVER
jgi:phage shock protein E